VRLRPKKTDMAALVDLARGRCTSPTARGIWARVDGRYMHDAAKAVGGGDSRAPARSGPTDRSEEWFLIYFLRSILATARHGPPRVITGHFGREAQRRGTNYLEANPLLRLDRRLVCQCPQILPGLTSRALGI
jgi:hypothetical protein